MLKMLNLKACLLFQKVLKILILHFMHLSFIQTLQYTDVSMECYTFNGHISKLKDLFLRIKQYSRDKILTHQADIDMKYCNNMVSIQFHRSSLNTNCHQVFKLGFVIARLQILNTLVCSF